MRDHGCDPGLRAGARPSPPPASGPGYGPQGQPPSTAAAITAPTATAASWIRGETSLILSTSFLDERKSPPGEET